MWVFLTLKGMFGALSNVESKPNSHLRSKLDVWRCTVASPWDDKDLLEIVEGAGHSKLCFWGSKLSLLRLYTDESESRVCDLFLARNLRWSFCCFSRRNEPFFSVMLPKKNVCKVFLSQHHSSFKVILGILIIRLCECEEPGKYVTLKLNGTWWLGFRRKKTWTQICRFSPKDVSQMKEIIIKDRKKIILAKLFSTNGSQVTNTGEKTI